MHSQVNTLRQRMSMLLNSPLVLLTVAATALRLFMFIGRGEYVAFDEGFYLLLGRNLLSGDGYTLAGLRHTALSPLFPILAGGLNVIIGDPIWAGRIVAALTSGLLIVPCWFLFRRLSGRSTALLGCGIIAVLPALAPFVAPVWMGWDLWVGAEPVFHLFLFTGLAVSLRAFQDGRTTDWAWAGATFALAYLARPEAAAVGGLVGVIVLGALAWQVVRRALTDRRDPNRTRAFFPHNRSPKLFAVQRQGGLRALAAPALLALTFGLLAMPYWLYLHDATGRWTLTGRGVSVTSSVAALGGNGGSNSSSTIESMMWQGRHGDYVRGLYALAPSGVRLASSYWGVPEAESAPATMNVPAANGMVAPAGIPRLSDASPESRAAQNATAVETNSANPVAAPPPLPGKHLLYIETLRQLIPIILWPFILAGLLAPARRLRRRWELFAFGPIAAASIAIAIIVAVDQRTQLFILPVLAFYAARGGRWLAVHFDRRFRPAFMKRGVLASLIGIMFFGTMFAEDMYRVYMGATVGSRHQTVGFGNRVVGNELREIVPPGEPVMTWHPAIALHAERPWRVRPWETLGEIVRYAHAIGCRFIVLSTTNPSPLSREKMPRPYLLLRLTPDDAGGAEWRIVGENMGDVLAVARLEPIRMLDESGSRASG